MKTNLYNLELEVLLILITLIIVFLFLIFVNYYIGGVAQLARACGSYPQCPEFESQHRHQAYD